MHSVRTFGDPESFSAPCSLRDLKRPHQFLPFVEADGSRAWGGGQGGSPFFRPSYLKTAAESDELGAGSATGPSGDPAKFGMGHPSPVAPASTRKRCPLLCGWAWRRKRRRLQQGEAHLATVSPGVLQATPGVATTSPFPTMEPSRARRRYLSDSPYRWGRPDQWICGEDECSSSS